MLRVTTTKERHLAIWILAFISTALLHFGFFVAGLGWAESKPHRTYQSSRVEFRTVRRPVPPKPISRPDHDTEKNEPPMPKKTEKKVAKAADRRRPRMNVSQPKQKPTPNTEEREPAKPVFGASADSVVSQGGAVAVRVGNTLEKAMDDTFTAQRDVAPIAPTDKKAARPAPEKKKRIPKPVPVYELSRAPTFKRKIEPIYPEQARRAGIEGVVQLETLIDENGRVRKIKVLKSPGHGLEKAAISALSKSQFHPGLVGGKPVPVKIKIPYRFVLDA